MTVTHALGINKYRRWRARVGDPERVLKRIYVALTLKHIQTHSLFLSGQIPSVLKRIACANACARRARQLAARSSPRRAPLHDSSLHYYHHTPSCTASRWFIPPRSLPSAAAASLAPRNGNASPAPQNPTTAGGCGCCGRCGGCQLRPVSRRGGPAPSAPVPLRSSIGSRQRRSEYARR